MNDCCFYGKGGEPPRKKEPIVELEYIPIKQTYSKKKIVRKPKPDDYHASF